MLFSCPEVPETSQFSVLAGGVIAGNIFLIVISLYVHGLLCKNVTQTKQPQTLSLWVIRPRVRVDEQMPFIIISVGKKPSL